ncbi:MAG TPA: LLM class flavin-dependent oxidoreductase [Stellaceae bacterium]|nr:LLM class flavin-dependent oxidoreductase [Stellaceae bacterium]
MKFDYYILNVYLPDRDGPPQMLYDKWTEQVLLAEQLGYDTLWLTEHHFRNFGGMCPNPQLLLAAMAARTRRIRLGTAVTVLPLHHPLRIAEDMAMLDLISGGRLELGIGRGMPQAEYEIFGARWEDSQARLEEAIAVIRRAWTGDPFQWQGTHYNYARPITLLPPPLQRPHPPIWATANFEEEHFRWIGSQGFNLMTLPWLSPSNARTRALIQAWRESLAASGFDPASRELLVMYFTQVRQSEAEAREAAEAWLKSFGGSPGERGGEYLQGLDYDRLMRETRAIIGDPARCRDQVAFLQEYFGATHVATLHHFGGFAQDKVLGSMRLFAAEVAPRFRL